MNPAPRAPRPLHGRTYVNGQDEDADDQRRTVRHLRDVIRGAASADYVVKGFARPGRGRGPVIFGESGSLKTFLLVDLAGLTVRPPAPSAGLGHRGEAGAACCSSSARVRPGCRKRLHAPWLVDQRVAAMLPGFAGGRTHHAGKSCTRHLEGLRTMFAEAEAEIRPAGASGGLRPARLRCWPTATNPRMRTWRLPSARCARPSAASALRC